MKDEFLKGLQSGVNLANEDKFDEAITKIELSFPYATRTVLAVSSDTNFRKEILPSYKSNRKVKPVVLKQLREFVISQRTGVLKKSVLLFSRLATFSSDTPCLSDNSWKRWNNVADGPGGEEQRFFSPFPPSRRHRFKAMNSYAAYP